LVIAGSGRDRERLQALAGPTVEFHGFVAPDQLPDLLARCRAFVWPGEEDFGIAPLNAMAAGRPVIAFAAGGALETIIPGQTGVFFTGQTVAAIIRAVEAFDPATLPVAAIRRHAEQFDTAVFKRRIQTFVEQKLEEGKQS
jgi:glycosyltransferase involved in cell wall biosynthesis